MSSKTEHDIELLRDWIEAVPEKDMVFFGGAGVSTESGIPDFRSEDGLYAQHFRYPPETMLSRSFFDTHPKDFFDFYFDRVVALDAKPNRAHKKLAELERDGKLDCVITQNIDGLHQAAGSKRVFELHGSILRNTCMTCGKQAALEEIIAAHQAADDGIPRCDVCGGIIKPDVVLYEEPLDQQTMMDAVDALRHAKLVVVAGTSLAVNPAASMLQYFRGDHLAIVNRSTTPYDSAADLVIPASIGDVFDF